MLNFTWNPEQKLKEEEEKLKREIEIKEVKRENDEGGGMRRSRRIQREVCALHHVDLLLNSVSKVRDT